jgi:hypothetical protein
MSAISDKEAYIFASGHYLTNHLPEDWEDWSEEKLDSFVEDNVWLPFEGWSAGDVWDNIANLAADLQDCYQKKENL